MARVVNDAGVALVKQWESLRLKAYLCSAGKPTIGWGHTAGVRMGMECTEAEAEAWLREDLGIAEAAVSKFVAVPLSDNQFGALVSFVFNVGREAFRTSTLRRRLNEGAYCAVPEQLLRWNKETKKGKKVVSKGLHFRRQAEVRLWNAAPRSGGDGVPKGDLGNEGGRVQLGDPREEEISPSDGLGRDDRG